MALGSAWSVGLSGLSTASDQLALVSRNVARAGDPSASRKIGEQTTTAGGSARLATIGRVADPVLRDGLFSARSSYSGEAVTTAALDRLHASVISDQSTSSPAVLVATLEADLRLFANDPTSRAAGAQVAGSARDLANGLNAASSAVTDLRTDADRAIADSVQSLNGLLRDLESVNGDILSAAPQADVTDLLDRRDALLNSVSEYTGIRVVPRDQRDLVVYTDSGVVLFERSAREVAFSTNGVLGPGVPGRDVTIDGVVVTGDNAVMPLRSGSIAAQVGVRDTIAPTFQTQLDELARGLIEAFSDPARAGSGKPDLPGLFTWSAGSVPASGASVPGLAALIKLNPSLDPATGGDLTLLRDGGASAPFDSDYNANLAGSAGFSDRLRKLVSNMSEARSFDATSGLRQTGSVKDFSSESVGWLNDLRLRSSQQLESRSVLNDRASEKLLSVTGINLDQEMSDLLKFEQSFQAASRLIATVDQMIKNILEVAR